MKYFIVLLVFLPSFLFAQNIDGYDGMINKVVGCSVPYGCAEQLIIDFKKNDGDIYILDAREQNEYDVSHIPKARMIGYDNFDIDIVYDIPKSANVYVYCSIGYRSGKIAEKMKEHGYENIYNLYGGIFNWANSGYPLVDIKNNPTQKVHGYNEQWSKWVNESRCIKVLK